LREVRCLHAVYSGYPTRRQPCWERRRKGANAVFDAGGNRVSGLCADERPPVAHPSSPRDNSPLEFQNPFRLERVLFACCRDTRPRVSENWNDVDGHPGRGIPTKKQMWYGEVGSVCNELRRPIYFW